MLLIAISTLPLLIMLVCRYPALILSSFLLVNLVEVFSPYYLTNSGPVKILPMDPVYFFAVTYMGIAFLRHPKKAVTVLRRNIFLTVFLGIIILYVIIYTPVHGQSAVGEARKIYGCFLFPLLALMVIKNTEDLRRFVQVVILAAVVVAIVASGLASAQGSMVRVVNSEGFLIITFAAFAMVMHYFHRLVVFHPTVDRVMLLVFAAFAIVSGHRTVWIALGFGLLFVFWLQLRRPGLLMTYAVFLVAFLIVAGSALVYFPDVGKKLGEKFEGIVDPYSDATASWRIEGWQDQLEKLQESGGLLFGDGVGGYYSWRYSGGGEVTASPHNAYVQMTLKLGLFGLFIYGLLAFEFFRRASAYRKKLPSGPLRAYIEMGMVNFGAAHGYMLGYGIVPVVFVFFAVAVCAINLSKNFDQFTTWAPAHAGKLKHNRWVPSMPIQRASATRYER